MQVVNCLHFLFFELMVLSSSPSPVPYFQEVLPTEVLVHMFTYLRERDLCVVAQVCRRLKEIASLESLWYVILLGGGGRGGGEH